MIKFISVKRPDLVNQCRCSHLAVSLSRFTRPTLQSEVRRGEIAGQTLQRLQPECPTCSQQFTHGQCRPQVLFATNTRLGEYESLMILPTGVNPGAA